MAKTILAVDDSRTIRRALELTFEGTEFRVEAVASEGEALDRLQAAPPAAVLVDAGLSGGAGYRLAGSVRSRDPAIPVVLLTSQTHAFDPRLGGQAGVDLCIDKPFDTQALIDLVARETEAAARDPAAARPSGRTEPSGPAAARRPVEISVDLGLDDGSQSVSLDAPGDEFEEIEEIDIEDVPDESLDLDGGPDEPMGFEVTPGRPEPQTEPSLPASRPPPPPEPSVPPARPSTPAPMAAPPSAGPSSSAAAAATAAATEAITASAAEAEPVLRALPADELRRIARDVIERVAWEVVPDLAETIIREELRRLTSE